MGPIRCHILPSMHTIELGTNSDIAFSGSFTTWFDDVKIVPHSSSSAALVAPSLSISGGPYFSLQVNNTSINTTSGSTTVVPLKVIWNSGFSAEPVHTAFIGNTTSVIPSITSVTNTTSSQLFNVNLNVPSSTQTGNYVVGITISEPDGDFKVIPIFVKIQ